MNTAEALKPSAALLSKIGSIVVHADEIMSADGHACDRVALEQLLRDPEIVDWIKAMGPMVPKKRK